MEGLREIFFTEEDFESYSSQPSLLEYLQTFITSKSNQANVDRQFMENIQVETIAAQYGIDAQEKSRETIESDILKHFNKLVKNDSVFDIEYPKLSLLSTEDHKTFVEEYEKAVKGILLDDTKKDILKEIKAKVIFEQQEFQQFVYQFVRNNADKYNTVPTEAKEVFKIVQLPSSMMRIRILQIKDYVWYSYAIIVSNYKMTPWSLDEKRIKKLKQYYHLKQTIGLIVGAHFRSDPVLEFQDILLQVGDVPILVEPTERIKLLLDTDICKQGSLSEKGPLLLSEDPVALRLAKEHNVNVVVSSCCLQTLVDNQAPQFNQQWDIPVIVTEAQQGAASKDKSAHKIVFLEKPLPKKAFTSKQLIRKIYKRSLIKKLCKTDHVRARSFVYSLWKFGKFRLLIRCKLDAYKSNESSNLQTFFSIVSKPEFQCHFGYERLTVSETAQWWLKSFIRPKTTVLCGRIKTSNHEVLRIDEMTTSDVLSSGSVFNPAQGMKLIYQLFCCLMQLTSDFYLLTHERFAIHCCLYKNAQNSVSMKKPDLDLNARYSKPCRMENFTSVDVPWAGIDSELFLAEQIEQQRIPATFPSVSENTLKEIEKQRKNQMKLLCPANVGNASGRNKKKNKKKKKPQAKKMKLDEPEKEGPKSQINFKQNYDHDKGSEFFSHDLMPKGSTEGSSQRGGNRWSRRRARHARRQFLTYRDLDYSGL